MPCVQTRIHADFDSAESIVDSDLEDGELRKMLDAPLCVHGRGENYGSSHTPTASGKPEAKIIHKRGASAQRTQADHSRRESLRSNSSQEPPASGTPDAVFSSRSEEPGNQLESSFLKSKLGRSLLKGFKDNLLCQARSQIMKQAFPTWNKCSHEKTAGSPCAPREESFLVPLKYIEVIRHTQTCFGHTTRAQNLSAGLFTNFSDGPRSQSLSRKLELHVIGRHGRLRAWYQRFHPQFQQLTECTLRRHWRLHSNIVLFLSFFSLFTGRHASAVLYAIVFSRTHIWIETGLESGHLNSEFGWNIDRTHTRTTHLCTCRSSAHCPRRCFTHHANTRGSRANTAQDCALWCLQQDSVMSHMLPHVSQNTFTRSLSPTFRSYSPSLSCPSELDQETLRDPRRSGRKTKSASLTGNEPKVTQSDDPEVELDLNLGTDPYQIRVLDERILLDDYQNPSTEDTEESG